MTPEPLLIRLEFEDPEEAKYSITGTLLDTINDTVLTILVKREKVE